MTTFYLVRHGKSMNNVAGLLQGSVDDPANGLSQEGHEQAKNRASEFRSHRFDRIFSSPLARAFQTAEHFSKELNLDIIKMDALKERSTGDATGTDAVGYKKKYHDWERLTLQQKMHRVLVPNEDTPFYTAHRAKALLETLTFTHPNKTLLLVTHGGFMRALSILMGWYDFESFRKIDNTGYLIIDVMDEKLTLKKAVGVLSTKVTFRIE